MFLQQHKKFAKTLILFVSALFVLQTMWPALIAPRTANAQLATVATDANTAALVGIEAEESAAKKEEKVEDTVMDKLFKSLVLTAAITLKNVLIKIARKAAEQSVTYMATGGWGEGAMFYEQAYEGFKQDMKDQIVGQFLDSMSELLGHDICSPSIPFELDLKLSLQFNYADIGYEQVKKPDCTLEKLKGNWTAFAQGIHDKYKDVMKQIKNPSVESLAMLQETFDVAFTPSKSDVGVYLTAESSLVAKRDKEVEGAEKQRDENQGAKGVFSITGASIETPAWLTRSHSEQELEKAKDTTETEVRTSEDVLTEIPAQVGMAFLNTFASEFWQQMIIDKYFKKGLVEGTKAYNPEQKVFEKKQNLANELALAKINYSFSQKQIDLLSEFETCQENRQINNCVMDKSFAEAVRDASQDKPLTVARAMELGFLDGNKPLINPDDDRHKNVDCYEKGYCYSNLVKLRKARVIPIGWEIAALAVDPGANITLKNVVENFATCNALVNPDMSKFCHLIDPSWVLRYPAAQCKAMVNGPLLVSGGGADRGEYCADLSSCIRMNDQGKCEAFGYCAAEKNIFRFGGTECNGAYDSCRVLKNDKGKEVSYLQNTVDNKFCDGSSAGCAWYSVWKDAKKDWQWSSATKDRIYLNKKILDMECKPGEEGCTRFVRTASGLGTNLIANSGFELQTGTDAAVTQTPMRTVPGWQVENTVSKDAYDGNYSVFVFNTKSLKANQIYFPPKFHTRYFAVSAYVKKYSGAPTAVDIVLSNAAINQNVWSVFTDLPFKQNLLSGDEWSRVQKIVRMESHPLTAGGGEMNLEITVDAGVALVDQVMLEEIDSPFPDAMHAYNEYATQNVTYLKKAPAYLTCYNTNSTQNYLDGRPNVKADIEEADDAKSADTFKGCDKFARLCTAAEVGCNSYKPADKGATVYGVASYSDYCPQECAGYESYSQSPTFFENGVFPLYFIPSTGSKCNAAEAGCDEFTNLDELAKGGEAKEYYVEPKLCAKLPESAVQCESYYTWESKEVTGYKLQSYLLQKGEAGAPKLIHYSFENNCTQEIYLQKSNPDCRQFFNKAGEPFYRMASKTITCSVDCHPYRRTLKFADEKSCVERQGAWKGGECIFMIIPGEGKKCGAANAACREYKGNQSGVEKVLENFTFIAADNASNPLTELEMSAGSTATASVEFGPILSVAVKDGSASVFTNKDKVALSPDYYRISFWIKRNGVDGSFKAELRDGGAVKYTLGEAALKDDWQQFVFEIKPEQLADPLSIGVSSAAPFYLDNFKIVRVVEFEYLIKKSWVTPKVCDYKLNTEVNDPANFMPQAMLGCREFTDKDNAKNYLKSFSGLCSPDKVGCEAVIDTQNNSWPVAKDYKVEVSFDRLCYEAAMTINLPSGQTPAGHYRMDEQNRCIIPVKKINVNNEEVLGEFVVGITEQMCGGDYLWENDKCYELQASVPADRLVYLVINKAAACDAGAKGCMAMGLPALTVDAAGAATVKVDTKKKTNNKEVWSNQFYKLDPDMAEEPALNNPLCSRSENGCREYHDTQGAAVYFKDPGDRVCEYRKVTKGVAPEYGWYKKKTDLDGNGKIEGAEAQDAACETEDYFNTGLKNPVRNTDFEDSDKADGKIDTYTGWAGACPKKEDKCTAFVDPTDIGQSSRGRPYYFYDNNQIDRGSCQAVNRKEGCVLFFDTALSPDALGLAGANYWAFETYIKSNDAGKAVDPVKTGDIYSSISQAKNNAFLNTLITQGLGGGTKTELNDVVELVLNAIDESACNQYVYCQFMADCIAKENGLAKCYNRVQETDLLPAVDKTQYNCAEVKTTGTPAENQALLESLQDAIKNAYCTVKKIMKPNANTMIKVIQDRDCAEWYACQASHWNWDPATSKYVEVCDRVGLCDKLDQGKESVKCQRFVSEVDQENLLSVNEALAGNYANRSTGWYAFDYSGYAVPQLSPIHFYNAFDVNQGDDKNKNIKMTCGGWPGGNVCKKDADCVCPDTDKDCEKQSCEVVKDYRLVNQSGLSCKVDMDCIAPAGGGSYSDFCATGKPCRCLNNVCVRPFVPESTFADSKAPACRAYPEKSSPFPAAVEGTQQYANVNIMYADDANDKKNMDFACRYRKVTYGGKAITKYFPKDSLYTPSLPGGVCQDDPDTVCGCDGGALNNKTMCSSATCGGTADNPGTCYKRDAKAVDYAGWQGYCLEDDKSFDLYNGTDEHPCLTWYPSYTLSGLMDTSNDYAAAGFNATAYGYTNAGPYYCTKANRWEKRATFIEQEKGYIDCDGNEDNRAVSGFPTDVINEGGGEDAGSACQMSDDHWKATSLYDCIRQDCSDQDCGGGDADQPYCPENYDVGNITFYDQGGEDYDQCSVEDEDKMFFQYWCSPANAGLVGTENNDPAKDQSFWYPDYDKKIVLDNDAKYVLTDYGGTKVDKINEKPEIEKLLTEVERLNCDEFYLMDKGGENKAYTNRIYQGYSDPTWPAGKCPAQISSKVPGFDMTIADANDEDKNCGPYGALGVDLAADRDIKKIDNVLLYTEEIKSKPTEMKCQKGSELILENGGAQCFTKIQGELDKLFAAHYGSWNMTEKKAPTGKCFSEVFPELNSETCQTDQFCQEKLLTEYCKYFELKVCNNTNLATPCFTDKECNKGAGKAYAGVDEEGESVMKNCVIPAGDIALEVTKEVCDSMSGDTFIDNSLSSDECYIYKYLSDYSACSYGWGVFGKYATSPQTPSKRQITDSTAICNKAYYSSSDTEVFYEQTLDPNDWSDIEGIAHPPMIAGVESADKADSAGKPLYTALPHKITVSTPAMTKSFGHIVGEGGQLEVTVKFYAWANDDQMPLTKVRVYWGVGNPSGSENAKYQNHKPRCQRTPGEKLSHCLYFKEKSADINVAVNSGLALTCDMSSLQCKGFDIGFGAYCGTINAGGDDNFGDTAEKNNQKANACLEGYFSFSNTYTCSAAQLALMTNCPSINGNDVQSCKEKINGRLACRYRPAVQVMDNWGWCNADHGNEGEIVDVKTNNAGGAGGYWDGKLECDFGEVKNSAEYYDGFIYVIP